MLALGLVGEAAVAAPQPTAAAAAASVYTSLAPQSTTVKVGEAVWFTGRVSSNGTNLSGRNVTIDRRPVGGSWNQWSVIARARTNTWGRFTVTHRPAATYEYRARVAASGSYASSYSAAKRVTVGGVYRTLEQRVDAVPLVGAARGSAVRVTKYGKSVRYRSHQNALAVEVTSGSTKRAWLVTGNIRTKYMDAGGPRGYLGAPVVDQKCVLLETGCVQRFMGGTIYDNINTSPAVTTVTGVQGELVAAARSQVGYAAPANNISKYNRWIGTTNAWCSIFQSWVSEASGNPNVLPKRGKFTSYYSAITGYRKRLSGPRVGAIAFFDTHTYDGVTRATHAGLIYRVANGYIYTIEGNTSNPTTGKGRGVYLKVRRASLPLSYWWPY